MRGSQIASEKEQRLLALCRRLIEHKSYSSQQALRRDLQRHGFQNISQSTVSRLLKQLRVVKMRNAKGEKIYVLNPMEQPKPDAARSVSEMVLGIEHNNEFILIHTVAGYGRAVAKILDHLAVPEVLGVVSASNVVWVAPRKIRKTPLLHRRLIQTLRLYLEE